MVVGRVAGVTMMKGGADGGLGVVMGWFVTLVGVA